MAKRIVTDGAPAAIGPYSQAIKVGKTLYVSGMMPIDPETGAFAGTTIEAQAEQIMKNIGSVLAGGRLWLPRCGESHLLPLRHE